MALPATDDFNRADGGLGANWTTHLAAPTIASNQAVAATSNAYNSAYWNADAFGADQYSEIIVGDADAYRGCLVRASGSGGSANAYGCYAGSSLNSFGLPVGKWVAGSFSVLDTISFGLVTDDRLRLEVSGTTLRVYVNDTQVGTDLTDTDLSAGSAGIVLYQSAETPCINAWDGGNLGGGGGGGGNPAAKRFGGVPFMGAGGFKGNFGSTIWREVASGLLVPQGA